MTGIPYAMEAGSGPPIVFLHGWTMHSGLFGNQFERLSDRFRCIAPDLPGHGRALGETPSVEGAAALLASVLESRGLEDVTLIGWSLGAAVSWAYLERYGASRIARMMSVDMSPKIVNEAGWTLGLKGQTREKTTANSARFTRDWASSAPAIAAGMFGNRKGAPDFDFDAAVRQVRSTDPDAMNAMWSSLTAADSRDLVGRMDIPLLAAHGARSKVYPAETAIWLADTASQGRRHEFQASGHSPHLEEPDAFARVVADFAS